MFYLTPIPQFEMGKINLWTGQWFYNHVKIVCVTCLISLKMGVWTGAMKSLGGTLLNGIHHSYSVAAHWFGGTDCCCSPELPLLKWREGMRMRLTGKWQQLILLVISLGNRCKLYVKVKIKCQNKINFTESLTHNSWELLQTKMKLIKIIFMKECVQSYY